MQAIHGTTGETSSYKIVSRLNDKGNLQFCIKRAFIHSRTHCDFCGDGGIEWRDVYHSGHKTWASLSVIQKEILEIKRVEEKYGHVFELLE
jgi:hypothetical protein